MTDKLIVFDTTVRNGEQSPGAAMTRGEKMRIVKAINRAFSISSKVHPRV